MTPLGKCVEEESPMKRQLIISENSVPKHIDDWLKAGCRQVVVVTARNVNEIVQTCVAAAKRRGLPVEYCHPHVEHMLAAVGI